MNLSAPVLPRTKLLPRYGASPAGTTGESLTFGSLGGMPPSTSSGSSPALIDWTAALVFAHPQVSLHSAGDAIAAWLILNEDGTETVTAPAYY